MKKIIIAGMVLLAGAVLSFSSSGEGKKAEFFSGVVLLRSAAALTEEQKAEKYRELQMMTGITTARARALLNTYRGSPEEWQRINGEMTRLISELKTPGTPDPKNNR